MKATINSWKRELANKEAELLVHEEALLNKDFNSDMRDFIRSSILSSKNRIKHLKKTIGLLEQLKGGEPNE